MQPGNFDWPDQYAGDTAGIMSFTLKENGQPIDLTGASIRMQVRRKPNGTVLLSLTSSPSASITITDALGGEFTIGGQTNPDIEAALVYDIEVTFPDGTVTTYLRGIYPVYGQVTE